MTDAELALVTTAIGGVFAFARWAVGLWATVRREDIMADKDTAEQQRAESARMVEALREQARSNAMLAGRIEQLSEKLDTLVEWRERVPTETGDWRERYEETDNFDADRPPSRPRAASRDRASSGYRPPRPGGHND